MNDPAGGLSCDKIIARLADYVKMEVRIDDLDADKIESLGEELFYSWYSHHEYVIGLERTRLFNSRSHSTSFAFQSSFVRQKTAMRFSNIMQPMDFAESLLKQAYATSASRNCCSQKVQIMLSTLINIGGGNLAVKSQAAC